MEIDRPGPGEELNSGVVTPPRAAATVILLRGGSEHLELLLVQRNPEARFMGGAWVFPGGAVDRDEGDGQGALRAAAVREVAEEAGIALARSGEELNSGVVTPPRAAATVILLRGGSEHLELLLVQRNPEARFMGGAWVFPGGAVDRDEGDGQGALRAAAVREVAEEAGIALA